MARGAHAAGYAILGFSSHAPLPFETTWNLKASRLQEYAATVRSHAAHWRGRGLEILVGLETDWIEGVCAPSDPSHRGIDPDYLIGSVHFVRTDSGEAFTVDEPEAEFLTNLARHSGGDSSLVWREYYRNLAAMIESGGFDILGHFDLVRKNNRDSLLFDESARDYRAVAFAVADLAAERGCIVEINTGGVARGKTDTPYPSDAVLARLCAKGARITFGDDAHAPEHMGTYNALALDHARRAGFRSAWYIDSSRIWKEMPLDEFR